MSEHLTPVTELPVAPPAAPPGAPSVALPADGPGAGPAASAPELRGLVAVAAGALLLVAVLWWWQRPTVVPAPAAAGTEGAAGVGVAVPTVPGGAVLLVHVTGAVATPGVVRAPDGARVVDVLELAGGALADADLGALNLARLVADGEQVVVPRVGEATAPGAAGVRADGRVDLNRASAEELEALPGIGPVIARRIVEHREREGPFATVGDLRAVPGIGEKTFQALADLLVV